MVAGVSTKEGLSDMFLASVLRIPGGFDCHLLLTVDT